MPKRIAITIAGAVSLGSYEAGVMYELLEALRIHNQAADKNRTPDRKVYVDVITGASAGGMTAAMLGEWLMFDGPSFLAPGNNPLYHAWVERINLKGLVKLQKGESKWHSLFSSDLISEIGDEMLVAPMSPAKPLYPHPCLELDAAGHPLPLRLGLALTNLNGIDYTIPIAGNDDGGFNYTRSVDRQLFTVRADGLKLLDPDGTERPSPWPALRDAAVASGAFPFAFRPRGVSRSQAEFVSSQTPLWPGKGRGVEGTAYVQWGSADPCQFAYSDGGVLQNQPLGMAKDLVDMAVGGRLQSATALGNNAAVRESHQDADNRLYAFVSPNAVLSSARDLEANRISLAKMLPGIVHTYLRQATFHDWIMAERENQNVRLLDERAKELAAALNAGALDVGTLSAASAQLNDLLLQGNGEGPLERLRNQYAKLYDSVRSSCDQMTADTFVSTLATLEAAARLGNTDKMRIFAVLADGRNELAGSGISAFVGFFSRVFREHDYLVGRVKARAYLARNDVQGILGLNLPAIQQMWSSNPLADPNAMLKVPLNWMQMLRPGIGSLCALVWIRVWKPLVVLAVLAILVCLAVIAASHHF